MFAFLHNVTMYIIGGFYITRIRKPGLGKPGYKKLAAPHVLKVSDMKI